MNTHNLGYLKHQIETKHSRPGKMTDHEYAVNRNMLEAIKTTK